MVAIRCRRGSLGALIHRSTRLRRQIFTRSRLAAGRYEVCQSRPLPCAMGIVLCRSVNRPPKKTVRRVVGGPFRCQKVTSHHARAMRDQPFATRAAFHPVPHSSGSALISRLRRAPLHGEARLKVLEDHVPGTSDPPQVASFGHNERRCVVAPPRKWRLFDHFGLHGRYIDRRRYFIYKSNSRAMAGERAAHAGRILPYSPSGGRG